MVSNAEIFLRLLIATVLGGLIGLERERHEKAAGFRTHILVCMGACLVMLTSIHIFEVYKGIAEVDPSRMAAQVISGIGFLGAGTIIRFRVSIVGLTTAASLWAIAGVGLAIGSGLYMVSIFAVLLILASLTILSRFQQKLFQEDKR